MCSFTKKIFFYLCVIKLRLKFTVINEVHKVFVLHKSIKKKNPQTTVGSAPKHKSQHEIH